MSNAVTVRIPASTSNLGGGFDCVGVAVDRWLDVTVTLAPGRGGFTVERRGTLASYTGAPADDRMVTGFVAACQRATRTLPDAVAFAAASTIPVGRGLGSSAAATLTGVIAANVLLEIGLSDLAIASLAAELEGHPDNTAPALFGGARLALIGADRSLVITTLDIHESLALVFAIPDFSVETAAARAVLPPAVPHATATRAAALGAALVHGLANGDGRLLAAALDDVLHVPFRRQLVAGFDAVTLAARHVGAFGATLSGSGSTIVAIAPIAAAAEVARGMVAAWQAQGIAAEGFVNPPSVGGAVITRLDTATSPGAPPARSRQPGITV